MLHRSCLWCDVGRRKVFEVFCREQLLTNSSLRTLTQGERKKCMSEQFKELTPEVRQELKQRATIEVLHQEALERAASFFKPVTPYEFFAQEQLNNPAFASAAPREKEVKLQQIYESLPENAKEALRIRTEQYNAAGSKKPEAPALPVIPVLKKSAASPSNAVKGTKGARKKGKKRSKKVKSKARTPHRAAQGAPDEAATLTHDGKEAPPRKRNVSSPYAVFVKEQMASLHHLTPKERMRAIGERWRSLTPEERQRRLQAAKEMLATEAAASVQKLAASPVDTASSLEERPVGASTTASAAANDFSPPKELGKVGPATSTAANDAAARAPSTSSLPTVY